MLSVVATPIGNLDDITLRALKTLQSANLIAAEDTRHTAILLRHHNIPTPLISLHEHNEKKRLPTLLHRMLSGCHIALVSDAGTPTISDPGYPLIRAAISAGIPVTVIPGPCAAITALAGSGLPPEPFFFGGFLPPKKGRLSHTIQIALQQNFTSIFYESPYRLPRTLSLVASLEPSRHVCIARELTKKFEQFLRGTAEELSTQFSITPPKGEICLIISGKNFSPPSASEITPN